MVRDELSVLSAFLLVAEERSFTRAARRLGVSPSALSHAIRGLEGRFGVRLLARTTRSVAPTDAGEQLLMRLRPALGDIRGALDLISGLRDRPVGRVRLVVSPLAAKTVLAPKLGQFARDYPDVVLDVTSSEARVDLVAARFDAGIHLGEFIERDMVAIRVSPDRRPAIVGSPGYFASHPKPASPRDLTGHRCISFRHQPDSVYRWEFDKGRQSLTVAVQGPLIVDDVELIVHAAIDGVGLAFMAEETAAPHLATGALVRVLEDWCPPYPGFFLYYPMQRHLPPALAVLIDTLRLRR
ncbi:MAG TPA: LysR family transcriptional regulator [Candidatus Dormibacteraeota bacterium]|nr:LysR family transcriptional regulator [Candidatus Dormibacteraeota bacterium]